MHKILVLLLLTFTFLFSSQMGVVHSLDPNGDGFLSIRTKPKQAEIGKLYNGDKVQILSKKGKYYKIKKMSNGQVGYAHSNWIRKTSSTATASNSTSSKSGVVTGLDPNGDGFLSLRSKPRGREIGRLYNGDKVTILDERGKWYKVKTASAGQVGWAHENWVRQMSEEKDEEGVLSSNNKKNNIARCDANHVKKCIDLGKKYLAEKNNVKALTYFKKACDYEDVDGCVLTHKLLKRIDSSIDIRDIVILYPHDKEIILPLIKKDPGSLAYAGKDLQNDKEIVMAAIGENIFTFEDTGNRIRDDKEVMMAVVKKSPSYLEYASDRLRDDKELVITALSSEGLANSSFLYASDRLKNDYDVIKLFAATSSTGYAFEKLSNRLKDNKKFILLVLSVNGFMYDNVSARLKNDIDVIAAALTSEHYALSIDELNNTLKDNKTIALAAVSKSAFALKEISDRLKKDKEVVLKAVRSDGYGLEYANENFKDDQEVVLAAVKENGNALRYTSSRLKNDEEVLYEAGKQSISSLVYATKENSEKIKKIKIDIFREKCDNNISIDVYCKRVGDAYFYGTFGQVDLDKALKYYKKVQMLNLASSKFNINAIMQLKGKYNDLIKNVEKTNIYEIKPCEKVYGYYTYAATYMQIEPMLNIVIEYHVQCDSDLNVIGLIIKNSDSLWYTMNTLKNRIASDKFELKGTVYAITQDFLISYIPEEEKEKLSKKLEEARKVFNKMSPSEKEKFTKAERMLSPEGLGYPKIKNKKEFFNILKSPTKFLYSEQGYKLETNFNTPNVIEDTPPIAKNTCEEGNGYACLKEGIKYYEEKDFLKASSFFKKACEHGKTDGCVLLGTMYVIGEGVVQDTTRGFTLFEKACNAKHIKACNHLGSAYLFGEEGVKQDIIKGVKFLEKACTGEDTESCTILGKIYYMGEGGLQKNIPKGIEFLEKACNGGDTESCIVLGKIYYDGEEVEKNISKGIKFLEKACSGGNLEICKMLEESN